MNRQLMIRDARPTGGIHCLKNEVLLDRGPVIVHECDECASICVQRVRSLAPLLLYGSVVVLRDRPELAAINDWFTSAHLRYWNPAGLEAGERAWVKSAADGGYGSHLPYLLAAVRATTGPVLELGCGDGSTPELHNACWGRKLVTVDNDLAWLTKFEAAESPLHTLVRAPDPAETKFLNEEWSVVFVDHAPGETRKRAVERARDKAEFIVVHDSEDVGYQIWDTLESFKFKRHFRYMRPWTSVVSMTRPIELGELPGGGQ